MKRKLTEKEKNNIIKMCKSEIGLLGNYANVIKTILSFITILLFLFFYNQIKFGNVIFYIIVALILSIIEIIQISKLQSPFTNILNDKYICFEGEMIGSRKLRPTKSDYGVNNDTVYTLYWYYVIANIDGENNEIEYKGKDFDRLKLGDTLIVVEYDTFKKKKYICFSYDELNK